ANAIREEIMRLITVHLVVVFWARAIIGCPQAGRNLGTWKRASKWGLFRELRRAGDRLRCLSTILFERTT
ncbi:MAG: hypothetical protein DMG53_16690, partial [Acidobacteria bacterium]